MSNDSKSSTDQVVSNRPYLTQDKKSVNSGTISFRSRNAMSNVGRPNYVRTASPLHRSLLPLPTTSTANLNTVLSGIPTGPARSAGVSTMRGRGLSRSSSFPNIAYVENNQQFNDEHPVSPTSVGADTQSPPTRHSTSSVKHLTCFWWKEKGTCRFSDEECLYAHRDTGHYTDPPRQIIPGEPALAGRKLERAMRHFNITGHQSSASLNTMTGTHHGSRSSTPTVGGDSGNDTGLYLSSPLTSPLTISTQSHCIGPADHARLTNDNQFLRNLVESSSKEKAIMISTVEALQAENKGMKGELEGLRKAQEQLLAEREGLHRRIKQMEDENAPTYGQTRSVSNPFGAIGRGRVNTETRYLGGLLTED